MKKIINSLLVLILSVNFLTPIEAKEMVDVTNLVSGLPYTVSTPPRDIWEDTESKELTDGIYGSEDFTDPKWQGHHISDQEDKKRTITFDLGEAKSIKRITSNYVHNPTAGVRLPKQVTYRVSNDLNNWLVLANLQPKTVISSDFISRETIYWDGEREGVANNNTGVFSRYVQVEFEIDSPWVFIDEIEVLGHEGVGENIFIEKDLVGERVRANEMPSIFPNLEGLTNYTQRSEITSNIIDIEGDINELVQAKPLGSQEWVKFDNRGHNSEIIVDLGNRQDIMHIHFRTILNNEFKHPNKIDILISENGETWSPLYTLQNKFIENRTLNSIQEFIWDGRYDNFTNSSEDIHKAKATLVKFVIHSEYPFAMNNLSIFGSNHLYGESVSVVESQKPQLEVPEDADYLRRSDSLGNINDIGLIYNHVNQKWDPEHLIPYIAYVNKEGKIEDRFFDTLLYLGLRTPGTIQETKTFDTNTQNPAGLKEWKWYLNRTFEEGGDLDALNEASRLVEKELEDGYREKFFIMIPYPSTHLDFFGNLDNRDISFNPDIVSEKESLNNRIKAVEWYIDEVMHQLSLKDYEFLEFAGFYWVAENIESSIPYEEELIQSVSKKVDEKDSLFFWIPYFKASGYNKWKEYGFDFAIMQPNFYFNKYSKETRLEETSLLARKYGMGVEIEFDERMLIDADDSEEKIHKFLEYLRLGEKYAFNKDVMRAYYQGGKTMYKMAKSDNLKYRNLYDQLFNFINHNNRKFGNKNEQSSGEKELIPKDPKEDLEGHPGLTSEKPVDKEILPKPERKPLREQQINEADQLILQSIPNESVRGEKTLPKTGKFSLKLFAYGLILSGLYFYLEKK